MFIAPPPLEGVLTFTVPVALLFDGSASTSFDDSVVV